MIYFCDGKAEFSEAITLCHMILKKIIEYDVLVHKNLLLSKLKTVVLLNIQYQATFFRIL